MKKFIKAIKITLVKSIKKTESLIFFLNLLVASIVIFSFRDFNNIYSDIIWIFVVFSVAQLLFSILFLIGHFIELPYLNKKSYPLFYLTDLSLFTLYEWKRVNPLNFQSNISNTSMSHYLLDVCYNICKGDININNIDNQSNIGSINNSNKPCKINFIDLIKRKRIILLLYVILFLFFIAGCILLYIYSQNLVFLIFLYVLLLIIRITIINTYFVYNFLNSIIKLLIKKDLISISLLMNLGLYREMKLLLGLQNYEILRKVSIATRQ